MVYIHYREIFNTKSSANQEEERDMTKYSNLEPIQAKLSIVIVIVISTSRFPLDWFLALY
jgi:hypothetical protein